MMLFLPKTGRKGMWISTFLGIILFITTAIVGAILQDESGSIAENRTRIIASLVGSGTA